MVRALILVLLLANLAFFAWTQGWLDAVVGMRSIGDREPERMLSQVRPETIRILPPEAASEPAAVAALTCLEAGPFSDTEITAAQSAAQTALPTGSWTTVLVEQPGTWLVYMGRFASRDALTKKEDEIKRRKLPYEEIGAPPTLAPGLSLGRFNQQPAAVKALEQFTAQGVRTARVVEIEPASKQHVLRVDKAGAALAAQLASLKADVIGRAFAACTKPAGA